MSNKSELILKGFHTSSMPYLSPIHHKNSFGEIPFTLKQKKFTMAKSIDLNNMYQLMLKEANNQINRIEINRLMIHNRRQFIIKIKEFITQNRLSKILLFNTIFYLDILLSTKTKINFDKLSVGALILATKFNELNIKNPNMREYGLYFNGNCMSYMSDILQMEMICLKKLNYCLTYTQPIHFLQLLLSIGLVFNTDSNKAASNTINHNIYNLPYQVLEIVMEDIQYNNFNSLHIACSCIAITREMYHLDKWNGSFERISLIKFICFESAYVFAKSYIIYNHHYRTYDSKVLKAKLRRSLFDINNEFILKDSRADSVNHKNSSDKTFKFKNRHFRSKSSEKENNRYDEILGQDIKMKNRMKMKSSKSIREAMSLSSVNISELNTCKYRHRKMADMNFFAKAINKSCAINSALEKDEINYLNRYFNIKEDDNPPETKTNLMPNNVMSKHIDLTSIIYSSLLRCNNALHSNTHHKRRISVEEKKCSNASCPYTRRGKRNGSLTRSTFNYSELYKDKANKITNKNCSISSIRSKKQ